MYLAFTSSTSTQEGSSGGRWRTILGQRSSGGRSSRWPSGEGSPLPAWCIISDQGVQSTLRSLFLGKTEGGGHHPVAMGRTGSALDNAMAESFVSTLKAEQLVSRMEFPTRQAAKTAISSSIWRPSTTLAGCTHLWAIGVLRTSKRIEWEKLGSRKINVSALAGGSPRACAGTWTFFLPLLVFAIFALTSFLARSKIRKPKQSTKLSVSISFIAFGPDSHVDHLGNLLAVFQREQSPDDPVTAAVDPTEALQGTA